MKTYKQQQEQKKLDRITVAFWIMVSMAGYGACILQTIGALK